MNGDPTFCFDKCGWRNTECNMLHFQKVVNIRKYLKSYILLQNLIIFIMLGCKLVMDFLLLFLLNVVNMKHCCIFYSYLISFTYGKAKIVWKQSKQTCRHTFVCFVSERAILNYLPIFDHFMNILQIWYLKSLHADPHFLSYFLNQYQIRKHHEKFECIVNARSIMEHLPLINVHLVKVLLCSILL